MYIVRFNRRDDSLPEEYYYHHKEDAENHIELFSNDDSGLYTEIYLLEETVGDDVILRVVKV